MTTKMRRPLVLLALIGGAVLALAGCGSGSDTENIAGNGADLAFIDAMVPHHEMAIDMAKAAKERGEHPEIKKLAGEIAEAQQVEITQLNLIRDDLSTLKKTSLGVPSHLTGMDMSMITLSKAKPFDREFIDMMVPHHQGAIRMARAELKRGKSPALEKIAKDIVDAQSREINEMNAWRKSWYGKPSPAGGVPPESSQEGTHHDM